MPDIPKMITIQEARRSQSGKSLGIQDRTDNMWYQTKDWSLEMMVGATIYAQTSTSEFNGKQMHWINSYSMPEGQVGVPVPAPPQGQPLVGSHPQVNPAPAPMADRDRQGDCAQHRDFHHPARRFAGLRPRICGYRKPDRISILQGSAFTFRWFISH